LAQKIRVGRESGNTTLILLGLIKQSTNLLRKGEIQDIYGGFTLGQVNIGTAKEIFYIKKLFTFILILISLTY